MTSSTFSDLPNGSKGSFLIRTIKKFWALPAAANLDVNDPASVVIHHKIIRSKPLLKAVYRQWYEDYLKAFAATENVPGKIMELESGAGFLEELIPNLIKTDVASTPFIHKLPTFFASSPRPRIPFKTFYVLFGSYDDN